MIDLSELRRVARIKGLSLGYAEKDYLIDICLLSISRRTKDELIFKGGTSLYKFYKLDRFSEDIDFTARRKFNVNLLLKRIISDMKLFGVEAMIRDKKKVLNSFLINLRIKGPLYNGKPQSYSKIGIDINLKSSVDLEPMNAKYSPIYSDLPPFSLLIMQEKEILAEKVRAILERDKARDVYDLWFLLREGVEFNSDLVRTKLKYYNEKWSKNKFIKKLEEKKKIWKTELMPLITDIPEFEETKKFILKCVGS